MTPEETPAVKNIETPHQEEKPVEEPVENKQEEVLPASVPKAEQLNNVYTDPFFKAYFKR